MGTKGGHWDRNSYMAKWRWGGDAHSIATKYTHKMDTLLLSNHEEYWCNMVYGGWRTMGLGKSTPILKYGYGFGKPQPSGNL